MVQFEATSDNFLLELRALTITIYQSRYKQCFQLNFYWFSTPKSETLTLRAGICGLVPIAKLGWWVVTSCQRCNEVLKVAIFRTMSASKVAAARTATSKGSPVYFFWYSLPWNSRTNVEKSIVKVRKFRSSIISMSLRDAWTYFRSIAAVQHEIRALGHTCKFAAEKNTSIVIRRRISRSGSVVLWILTPTNHASSRPAAFTSCKSDKVEKKVEKK